MNDFVSHLGCPLHFSVNGSGPSVLFIQGVAVHGDGWRPQTESLADRFTCLSFDHRGMGRSNPVGDGAITVQQMADDARAIADHAKCEEMHVVGHSLGGLVALQFALANRRRVKSLTLMCTFGRGRDAAPLTPGMVWYGMRSRVGTRAMRRRGFLNLVMPRSVLAKADLEQLAAVLAPLFGHDLGDLPPIADAQLAAMRAFDAFPRLQELVGLPTLVLSASEDRIAPPAAGRKLAAAIAGARFIEVPDAAHGLPIHAAELVNEHLCSHFGS
ncbi:MAG: alpha/beta fold hydrolase [Gemmataceae bacterium]